MTDLVCCAGCGKVHYAWEPCPMMKCDERLMTQDAKLDKQWTKMPDGYKEVRQDHEDMMVRQKEQLLKSMAETVEHARVECAGDMMARQVHNSPPPLDDVGSDVSYMLDEKDPTLALLNERGKTHGDYRVHARITQSLKMAMRRDELEETWRWNLNDMQRETLEMIQHKVGRILAGDPNFPDHWEDIAGYAMLIVRQLTSRQE